TLHDGPVRRIRHLSDWNRAIPPRCNEYQTHQASGLCESCRRHSGRYSLPESRLLKCSRRSVPVWNPSLCYRRLRWVFLLDRIQPVHHPSQVFPDLLDKVILFIFSILIEPGTALLILPNPLSSKFAILNFFQDFLHILIDFFIENPRTSGVVTILGSV